MTPAQDIKDALKLALESLDIADAEITLEHPVDLANGDYATGIALQCAKRTGMNPRELAEKIVASLGEIPGVSKIDIAGPGFINFYLAPSELSQSVGEAREEKTWGRNDTNKGKKVMIEYTDPNPFKEFHIGHLMSNAVGESIARLTEYTGAEVKRANYQGDVGPHVAKAIWGKKQMPEASWGEAYVKGSGEYEEHKDEIDALNRKIYEKSDKEVNRLYAEGRKQSLEHFERLYEMLGTKFDYYFFESETAPRGIELVRENPKVFVGSEGAVVYHGPHTRVFLTSKGLPTYEAKELGLAELKWETWKFDSSITVTAHEQADYFAVVLAAMREVLPDIASKVSHVSHGVMRFAEGKMSSRTGNVITGELLLRELVKAARLRAARGQAKVRAAESRAEDRDALAQAVAVAAIKYQILRQQSSKDIIFDRERALSLEGDSGPYIQYAHARAHAVVERADSQGMALKIPQGQTLEISESANNLARLLARFPDIVERAAKDLEPQLVANYLVSLAAAFNRWYASEQILDGSPSAPHKVALTDAARATLKSGLWLLGIPAPERM